MDLRRKLARLRDRDEAPPPPVAPPESTTQPEAPADDLRARLKALSKRTRTKPRAPTATTLTPATPTTTPWPFDTVDTPDGPTLRALRRLEGDAKHGDVPVARALGVTGAQAATLALDTSLAGYDPRRALYLDTETTGLAGGAGTLAFLVGLAWFEGERLCIEQLLLDDLEREASLLTHVAARIREASALVSFNGRSFDMTLLRARFVMARVTAPPEPPHLDLLHVARRIYGARVERCALTTLERDVLRFERVGDVDGAAIPALYQRYLREGERARDDLLPVVEHNAWDLAALAALSGELGARLARGEAEGRFEARDLVGLARTTQRAGDADLAVLLAGEAAAQGAAQGDASVARDAHVLAARIHKRTRDAEAMCARLLDALAHCPADATLHLDLARCYERDLDDPVRALEHAQKAEGAEPAGALTRRVARLRRKVKALHLEQLRLPGIG